MLRNSSCILRVQSDLLSITLVHCYEHEQEHEQRAYCEHDAGLSLPSVGLLLYCQVYCWPYLAAYLSPTCKTTIIVFPLMSSMHLSCLCTLLFLTFLAVLLLLLLLQFCEELYIALRLSVM